MTTEEIKELARWHADRDANEASATDLDAITALALKNLAAINREQTKDWGRRFKLQEAALYLVTYAITFFNVIH
jgi:hypothetical protein